MKRLAVLLLLGLALSCSPESVDSPNQGPTGQTGWHDEGVNLLSLLNGATIVDRSGEISFEFASMLAIDGHPGSFWSSPPEDLEQWLVVELPVRSRIEAVGLSVGALAEKQSLAKEVQYEVSRDGESWLPVGVFEFDTTTLNQLPDIQPVEANFIRVTMLSNHGNSVFSHLPTLLARGEELDAYQRPSAAGRWKLNDVTAHLREDGTRVFGHVDMDPPMLIEGAWHDRIIRFSWVRDQTYGVGLLTINPDGDVLDGLWWYENAVEPRNELGTPWFGTRLGDPDEFWFDPSNVAQRHVERAGRFPFFGLIFDDEGQFDIEASRPALDFIRLALESFPDYRVRLEVSDFHSPDDDQNLARSHSLELSLRDELSETDLPMDRIVIEAIGSKRPYPQRDAPLHWMMYSRVDFALSASE